MRRLGCLWNVNRVWLRVMAALLFGAPLLLSLTPARAQEGGDAAGQEPLARVDQAMAHLSEYLGETVSRDRNLFYWEALTWPDASLYCPVGERTYPDTPVPGYRVRIVVRGVTYAYHMTADGAAMVLCIDGKPDPSSDWGPLGSKIDWWGLAARVEPGARLTVSGWGGGESAQPILAAIARFRDLFPGIEVEYRPERGDCAYLEDYYEVIKEQMAAGQASDVLAISPCLMSAFAPYQMLLPLDEYLSAASLSRDDYVPALTAMFSYEGKLYAVPQKMDALALVYLPHLFDEAGLPYPAPGWTWEDMKKAARTISEVTGVYGVCVTPDVAPWAAAVYQAGGTITDSEYTEARFNSPEAIAALEFWYGMYDDGYGALPTAFDMDGCAEALGRELAAMAWETLDHFDDLAEDFPGVAYAVAPLPAGPAGPGNVVFGVGVGVKASTEYPVAAALLALFLAGDESEQILMESGAGLPTLRALLDDPWFESHPDMAVFARGALIGRPFYFGHSFYFGLEHRTVRDRIQEALQAVFYGESDIQEALDAAVLRAR